MIVFIEFWKAKDLWHQKSKDFRAAYLANIPRANIELEKKGMVIDCWGLNENTTAEKAAYDFYAVAKFPTQDLADEFADAVQNAGWYEYFDQINMSGDNIGIDAVLKKMVDL